MPPSGTYLCDNAENLRLELTPKIARSERSSMGQFFTPPPTAELLSSFFYPFKSHVVLLDAGAGVGALTAAFVSRVLRKRGSVTSVRLVAYESCPSFFGPLKSVLSDCVKALKASGVAAEFEARQEDFILAATAELRGDGLFRKPVDRFTHAVLNPPYKKIPSGSEHARALLAAGIDTGNLYSAFVWLAGRLLAENGELSAITPRSFCNGPYFLPFRKFMQEQMAVDRVHVYEQRDAVFAGDEVLQENILFHARKTVRIVPKVTVTQSSGNSDDEAIAERIVPRAEFVRPGDAQLFWCIVADGLADSFAKQMRGFDTSLDALGLKVSTGPVVDFRLREHLRHEVSKGLAPLLYPLTFGKDGFVHWPPQFSKKPLAIEVNDRTSPWLISRGNYVLVKRFSAKEERRRVVAAVYDPSRNGNGGGIPRLGIENHLNFFHANGQGMASELARGLAGFLNSTLFDKYFRQFSGHTQVNSTDLRQILYPSKELLAEIGRRVHDAIPEQSALDRIVHEVLQILPETMSAFDASSRLDDAKAILKAVNAPSAQINERSALCLLALANLPPSRPWVEVSRPLRRITQMMDWFKEHYGKSYAPNTRETVRRQTMHQFVQMGLVVENPDKPSRAINSPHWCYQLSEPAASLIGAFGTDTWQKALSAYLSAVQNLLRRVDREMPRISVKLPNGRAIQISAGGQNDLIKAIIEDFCERFAAGGTVLYVGDAGDKFIVNEAGAFADLGIVLDPHGKMPDVVVHHTEKDWLLLIEAVTSHGPVDQKRRNELKKLFANGPGLVFVTAFPSRREMVKYVSNISWETEVWVADDPTHMIHFNGQRFLGPY